MKKQEKLSLNDHQMVFFSVPLQNQKCNERKKNYFQQNFSICKLQFSCHHSFQTRFADAVRSYQMLHVFTVLTSLKINLKSRKIRR